MQQHSIYPERLRETSNATGIKSSRAGEYSASVTTCQDFFAPGDAVLDALIFYEEVAGQRPFLLRRFLPTLIGTEGLKSEVGGEVTCRYVGGHLLNRVTHIISLVINDLSVSGQDYEPTYSQNFHSRGTLRQRLTLLLEQSFPTPAMRRKKKK